MHVQWIPKVPLLPYAQNFHPQFVSKQVGIGVDLQFLTRHRHLYPDKLFDRPSIVGIINTSKIDPASKVVKFLDLVGKDPVGAVGCIPFDE